MSPQSNSQPPAPDTKQAPDEDISFVRAMISVIQASFGVQNSKNRERDFTKGRFWIFVAAALIFTAIFVLTIAGIVSMVLPG